jgi:hypothetical protein
VKFEKVSLNVGFGRLEGEGEGGWQLEGNSLLASSSISSEWLASEKGALRPPLQGLPLLPL